MKRFAEEVDGVPRRSGFSGVVRMDRAGAVEFAEGVRARQPRPRPTPSPPRQRWAPAMTSGRGWRRHPSARAGSTQRRPSLRETTRTRPTATRRSAPARTKLPSACARPILFLDEQGGCDQPRHAGWRHAVAGASRGGHPGRLRARWLGGTERGRRGDGRAVRALGGGHAAAARPPQLRGDARLLEHPGQSVHTTRSTTPTSTSPRGRSASHCPGRTRRSCAATSPWRWPPEARAGSDLHRHGQRRAHPDPGAQTT